MHQRPEEALELRLWGRAPPEAYDEFRHSVVVLFLQKLWHSGGVVLPGVQSFQCFFFFGVLRKGRHIFTFTLLAKITGYFLALSNGGLGFTMDNFLRIPSLRRYFHKCPADYSEKSVGFVCFFWKLALLRS